MIIIFGVIHLGRFGFGYVARDHNGRLVQGLQAGKGSWEGRLSTEIAEAMRAMSLKEALSWCKDMQWNKVLIESYCQQLVHATKSSNNMVSPFGLVVQIKMLISLASKGTQREKVLFTWC